jgi:hypothetical protein
VGSNSDPETSFGGSVRSLRLGTLEPSASGSRVI